jgi:hypothetical protein
MKTATQPKLARGNASAGRKRACAEWDWLKGFDLQQAWGIGSKPANPGMPAKRVAKRFAAPCT